MFGERFQSFTKYDKCQQGKHHARRFFNNVEMLGLIYNAPKEFCFFIFVCIIFASSYIAIDGLEQNAESFLSLFIWTW